MFDVRLYNRALSTQEVNALYNSYFVAGEGEMPALYLAAVAAAEVGRYSPNLFVPGEGPTFGMRRTEAFPPAIAAGSVIDFRRTLSPLGTRVGSRQVHR